MEARLGLSICKQLASLLNGQISFESTEGIHIYHSVRQPNVKNANQAAMKRQRFCCL